ncbi:MAG: DUF4364 family protein [Eubacterium sp.]|nr:DUF4364 family protein [Eubacterium sp.]
MVESPYSLYKLIVLFTLNKVSYPMKNTQLADLFLQYDYTSYFHLQEVLAEMVETELLYMEPGDHATLYRIAPRGEETLSYFSGDISPDIRSEITTYLKEHAGELREEVLTTSGYSRASEQDYTVHCRVKEGNVTLIDLQLSAPTEASAQKLAENWKSRSSEVYDAVMRILR